MMIFLQRVIVFLLCGVYGCATYSMDWSEAINDITEIVQNPIIPFDCIGDIVCAKFLPPLIRTCHYIVDRTYNPPDVVLCNKLIKRYKRIEELSIVCKRAEQWLKNKWFSTIEDCRRSYLLLTQTDANILLQKCIAYEHKPCVLFTLKIGANINAPISHDDSSGLFMSGSMPLFLAIYNGDVGMVQLLLRNGAITNIVTAGFVTPTRLARAIQDTHVKMEDREPYTAIIQLLREDENQKKLRKKLKLYLLLFLACRSLSTHVFNKNDV